MRIETSDMVAAWMGHATYGLNALLLTVPLKSGHATPAPLAAIKQTTEDALTARWQLPPPDLSPTVYPLLQIGIGGSGSLDPHSRQGVRDGVVQVAFRLSDRDRSEGATAGRSTEVVLQGLEYRLRALEWSLDRLFSTADQMGSDRNLRNIHLFYIEQPLQLIEPFAPTEEGVCVGGGTVTFKVREKTPGGS